MFSSTCFHCKGICACIVNTDYNIALLYCKVCLFILFSSTVMNDYDLVFLRDEAIPNYEL